MLVAQLAADLVSEPAIVPTIALDLDDREPLRPHSRRVFPSAGSPCREESGFGSPIVK
jgi:hypothetical protein